MYLEERAEHEIDIIEQDESLTEEEKQKEIKCVIQDLQEALREQNNCW